MEILIVFWLGLFITYLMCHNSNMYCNSSYNRRKDALDIELDKPEYKIQKVERCYCKNNMGEICKYTILNFYIAGKNKVKHQELYFYDKVGAYNVGDILTLNDLSKDNKDYYKDIVQKAVGYLTSKTGLYANDIEKFKDYMLKRL